MQCASAALGSQSPLFQAILEKRLEPETMDELATLFTGMEIVSRNDPRSTGELGVIVGRIDEQGRRIMATLQMRREKAGWKVRDFETRVLDAPSSLRRAPGGEP